MDEAPCGQRLFEERAHPLRATRPVGGRAPLQPGAARSSARRRRRRRECALVAEAADLGGTQPRHDSGGGDGARRGAGGTTTTLPSHENRRRRRQEAMLAAAASTNASDATPAARSAAAAERRRRREGGVEDSPPRNLLSVSRADGEDEGAVAARTARGARLDGGRAGASPPRRCDVADGVADLGGRRGADDGARPRRAARRPSWRSFRHAPSAPSSSAARRATAARLACAISAVFGLTRRARRRTEETARPGAADGEPTARRGRPAASMVGARRGPRVLCVGLGARRRSLTQRVERAANLVGPTRAADAARDDAA